MCARYVRFHIKVNADAEIGAKGRETNWRISLLLDKGLSQKLSSFVLLLLVTFLLWQCKNIYTKYGHNSFKSEAVRGIKTETDANTNKHLISHWG